MVFPTFLSFLLFTQTEHFAKAVGFAWAIAFGRWPIFKIVSFLQYLVFFSRTFFAQNNSDVRVACFLAHFWDF